MPEMNKNGRGGVSVASWARGSIRVIFVSRRHLVTSSRRGDVKLFVLLIPSMRPINPFMLLPDGQRAWGARPARINKLAWLGFPIDFLSHPP